MNLKRFFDHWNLKENPFQAEEAKDDSVYRRILDEAMPHPDFEKIYGSPVQPSTAVVFGEKGSGKTAMRLLIEQRIQAHNRNAPGERCWIIRYDELNPMLDRLAHAVDPGNAEKTLGGIRLSDHQDAILSLGTTRLLDQVLGSQELPEADLRSLRKTLRRMPRQKRIDLAVLALLYDQPTSGDPSSRWVRVCSLLRVHSWFSPRAATHLTLGSLIIALAGAAGWRFDWAGWWWAPAAVAGTAAAALTLIAYWRQKWSNWRRARRIRKEVRVVDRVPGLLPRQLSELPGREIALQPLPEADESESRYDLIQRLLRILEETGYRSIIVLVDRVDEPVMVHGDKKRMQSIVWPMLNNKFLQQEGIGFKMLLPIELGDLLNRESEDFYRQARMDKQNLINPLEWTGATLYDVATRRLRSCQGTTGRRIEKLADLFEEGVGNGDLIAALDHMHQPRDAFKFLYSVIQEHCQNTPDDEPRYKIPKLTLEQVRKRHSQRVGNLARGLSPA
jgi:hypothetical protein